MEESQSSSPSELSELMERAAHGDSNAQREICLQYERQVIIVARVLLGPLLRPHLDTVDVMQSVHRSMLVGLRDQKFDISSPEKLIALACTIVRRKVARGWRKHRRQIRVDDSQMLDETLRSSLIESVESTDSPTNQVQIRDQIQTLCERLSDIEKTMILRKLEGFTTGEVAAQLQLHPVAIRVRWSRLRQRLEQSGITAKWLDDSPY